MRNLIKDIKANRPLLIQPEQANAHLERTAKVEMPLGAKLSDFSDMLSAMFGEPAKLEIYPPYAIVPVRGLISKNVSDLDVLCGCCDIENVEEMLESAERDASVKTVILVIDSPGGTSVGVPELAARIRGFSKEVLAFTDNEACSAAYWIGSQAKAFYATPSATVGSIGCYIAYPDCSKAYEMEGVKIDVIKSGLYKGAGIAGTSLDDKHREMLQKEVEEIHADFKADVKAVREFADDSAMEGQTFSGKNAAAAGLVTGLVNGFDELMESLDAAVAEQMEADEKNDAAAAGGQPEESDEGASAKVRRLASARALAGVDLKALSAAAKMAEGEKEDEDEEKPESEDEDDKEPKSEDDKDEEKPESNDEEDEGEDAKSEDDPDQDKAAPQPKSDEDEKKDDEDAKERAEDEEGDADDAVDTDEKPDKSGVKRNRSKGIA